LSNFPEIIAKLVVRIKWLVCEFAAGESADQKVQHSSGMSGLGAGGGLCTEGSSALPMRARGYQGPANLNECQGMPPRRFIRIFG
jgi:hypothetical protein